MESKAAIFNDYAGAGKGVLEKQAAPGPAE